MDPSFGARLRAHREQQQVALSAISAETKIKLSLLEALERDDVSQWPEGIFRRAYIRAYARSVGLDPEAIVREFLALYPDPIVTPFDTTTELETPEWPAGLRRVVTSAMAAVPSRFRRVEKAAVDALNYYGPPPEPCEPVEPLDAVERAAPVESELILQEPVEACDDTGADLLEAPATASAPQPAPPPLPATRPDPSLLEAADLCTRLGQALETHEITAILDDATRALDAVGAIVWTWDRRGAVLTPSIACGYPEALVARMPGVPAGADNAIAAACRSHDACVVNGSGETTGALAIPLLAPGGCAGVLAVELRHGDEGRESVRAFLMILAAQLVPLAGAAPLAEAVNA